MSPSNQKKGTTGKKSALIYLVDDELLLLDLAEATLQPLGYKLKRFQDPTAALQAFRREKTKPDLLLTDYAMGKMDGLELTGLCQEINPRLKTLLISGTAGAEILLTTQVKVDRFLGKPYQPETLVEIVRELLAEVPAV